MQSATPKNRSLSVWPLSLSLAATQKIDVSFSSCGYLDGSVPHVPSAWLWIHHTVTGLFPAGFPHSDICGSQDVCSSPQLFAAYHVLLRLLVPRHPPYALYSLIYNLSLSAKITDSSGLFLFLTLKLKSFFTQYHFRDSGKTRFFV